MGNLLICILSVSYFILLESTICDSYCIISTDITNVVDKQYSIKLLTYKKTSKSTCCLKETGMLLNLIVGSEMEDTPKVPSNLHFFSQK
jgi:hypothetical protein